MYKVGDWIRYTFSGENYHGKIISIDGNTFTSPLYSVDTFPLNQINGIKHLYKADILWKESFKEVRMLELKLMYD